LGVNLRDAAQPASAVIAALGLQAHPEGGWYRELWRDQPPGGGRGAGTAIHYLLAAGESSHWHRVDAAEAHALSTMDETFQEEFWGTDPASENKRARGAADVALAARLLALSREG
jgi:hypothetical protein